MPVLDLQRRRSGANSRLIVQGRFADRQLHTRDWINLEEIADWVAAEGGAFAMSEAKKKRVLDAIVRDFLSGRFESGGRSKVLFLHPYAGRKRLGRWDYLDAAVRNVDGERARSFLTCCWIPRAMATAFLDRNRVSNYLAFLSALSAAPRRKKGAAGRPATYNWTEVKSRLARNAEMKGPVSSLHDLLELTSSYATELDLQHRVPDDATVRAAIEKHRLDVAARFKAGK